MAAQIPKQEQLESLLTGRALAMAQKYIGSNQTLEDFRFVDMISIQEEELYRFAESKKFNFVSFSVPRDGWNISQEENGAKLFFKERGDVVECHKCDNISDAKKMLIHMIWTAAKIQLNHRYKTAHPELNLPRPSEM